mmetsp:Transcript_51248/g.109101  ORF Transcript_51248/g.109101 Transcript_51248/m.109101 type:complete len:128 (-) Transcript_51248:35-418(-)
MFIPPPESDGSPQSRRPLPRNDLPSAEHIHPSGPPMMPRPTGPNLMISSLGSMGLPYLGQLHRRHAWILGNNVCLQCQSSSALQNLADRSRHEMPGGHCGTEIDAFIGVMRAVINKDISRYVNPSKV